MRNAIVSACLLGINCRYDGGNSKNQKVFEFLEKNDLNPIPLCPEQLAGLPTPRVKCEIAGDGFDVLRGVCEVYSKDGRVFTPSFVKGAEETLKIAKIVRARMALLKSLSPSCGAGKIYDGSFSGRIRNGFGVTAALLKLNGIEIIEF
jgi:uncharacterized protein YbbK (DUF523 family)